MTEKILTSTEKDYMKASAREVRRRGAEVAALAGATIITAVVVPPLAVLPGALAVKKGLELRNDSASHNAISKAFNKR